MATKTWIGNAADVTQIQTITIGGTWSGTESATITCNGKPVTVTVVTDNATAEVATSLKEALMASQRLDGSSTYGTYDNTSNVGGQQFGEFMDFTATVSGSVITLTGRWPGVPFTVSVSEDSASGTITPATVQSCTGKNFWSNATNWDTGSVPANNDIVVFRDSAVDCLHGLPNGSLEVTIVQHQSYTGRIGLPVINRTHQDKPYYEYRQRYVRLDDSGSGTDIAHVFGLGIGGGSPLINIKHSAVKCSPTVYNTGRPGIPGTYALNICLTTDTSTLNILHGSVDCGSQDGSTAALATLAVGSVGGDDSASVSAINATKEDAVVSTSSGRLILGSALDIDRLSNWGGVTRVENHTAAFADIWLYQGRIEYASTGDITQLYVHPGAVFDATVDTRAFAIGVGAVLFEGGSYLDPYKRTTWTGTLQLQGSLARTTVDVGSGQVLQVV